MALKKVTYIDKRTRISAQNMNDIQDEIIKTEESFTVGNDFWGIHRIVDTLCPAFTESGPIVTCEPVEGYPLDVVSKIESLQEGSGDPYPNLWEDVPPINEYPVGENEFAFYVTEGVNYRTKPQDVQLTEIRIWDAVNNRSVTGEFDGHSTKFSMPEGFAGEVVISSVPETSLTLQKYIPGNIRPIVGHNEIELTHTGRNLFDDVAFYKANGYVQQEDGTWYGKCQSTKIHENTSGYAGQFTISCIGRRADPEMNSLVFQIVYADGTSQYVAFLGLKENTKKTATTKAGSAVKSIQWSYQKANSYLYIKDVQLEYGAVETPYEPYKGKVITAEVGQTVYGGSYNWKTGELILDRVKVVLSGNFGADGNQFYTPITQVAIDDVTKYNCICSHYPSATRNQVYSNRNTDGYIGCSASSNYIRIVDNARFKGDVNAFNAWLAENNIEVVYRLATPISVGYFEPQEIPALSGVNTLYSDKGETTVTGRADPNAVNSKLLDRIAALEAAIANNT